MSDQKSASFIRRPRVLVALDDPAETVAWRHYLGNNGCRVPRVVTLDKRMDVVLCGDAAIEALATSLPACTVFIVLGPWSEQSLPFKSMRLVRALTCPADPRHVLALTHAAMLGRFEEDVTPLSVDEDLSIVPGLHLVFWRDRLVAVPLAERRILCALALAPRRIFEWDELMRIGGCCRTSAHTSVTRIRSALRHRGASEEMIATVLGLGVSFKLT